MKGLPFVLAFTAMTFVAWGAYGPLLHHGTASMGRDSLRAFVGVGIAYFIIAVIVPVYILRKQGETGKWTLSGTLYSLVAGAVGAVGALGVILALSYGGMPVYVMPLVFGFAPIVNTLVTAWMSKTFDQISPIFIGGIVVASLGVGGVLAFKPTAPAHAAHPTGDTKSIAPQDSKTKDPQPDSPRHSHASRPSALRFVATLVPQEPLSQDELPPVVVQPPAPQSPAAPTAELPPSTPAPEPAPTEQPAATPPQEQATAPEAVIPAVALADELPPVVIQPASPADTAPAALAATPAPVAQEPQPAAVPPTTEPVALPPVVVLPTPLEQPAVEAPKTALAPEETKVIPQPEPISSEAIKSEVTPPVIEKTPSAEHVAAPVATPEVAPIAKTPANAGKPDTTEVVGTGAGKESSASPTETSTAKAPVPPAPNVPMIILSIVVAAICWGSYGPMLHQGQSRMAGSRLRPFTCVGLSYFMIAVAAPLAVIAARSSDMGSWSVGGLTWSIIAGAAGAIGALGVILAFNAGGKPYYVMPLVFGFAPVINTCISLTESGTWGLATPMFWASLAVVIAGAVTVLITAPKPHHPKPQATPAPATR